MNPMLERDMDMGFEYEYFQAAGATTIFCRLVFGANLLCYYFDGTKD